ncbi:tetratricopeptide repeat protein 31 isoform X2 [Sceloporus undulatus]|nr:tetratricopeptide repeat protein 31 isoform X2 [Sceloporus undulatus]
MTPTWSTHLQKPCQAQPIPSVPSLTASGRRLQDSDTALPALASSGFLGFLSRFQASLFPALLLWAGLVPPVLRPPGSAFLSPWCPAARGLTLRFLPGASWALLPAPPGFLRLRPSSLSPAFPLLSSPRGSGRVTTRSPSNTTAALRLGAIAIFPGPGHGSKANAEGPPDPGGEGRRPALPTAKMALAATPSSGSEAGKRPDAFPVPGGRGAVCAGSGAALPLPVSLARPPSGCSAMILARGPASSAENGEEAAAELALGGAGEGAYLRHLAFRRAGELCPVVSGELCWYCEDDDYSSEDWGDYTEEEEEEEGEEGAWNAPQGTFCGFKKFFLCKPPSDSPAHAGPTCIVLPQRQQQLTVEEAERNAEELVAEEERIKKKAEKKRQKKKRQKDRKKQEKRNQELKSKNEVAESSHGRDVDDQGSFAAVRSASGAGSPDSAKEPTEASPGKSPSGGTKEEKEATEATAVVEEELDLSSTFVSKARLKVSTKPLLPKREKAAKPDRKEAEAKVKLEAPRTGLQLTAVEQSMVLADCGNETAKQGCYQEAVLLFTEAVKLNPREYRFFGNRSFCFERLQCYAEALQDAQLALSLKPGWPKGLFRQGKALMGLKRYAEAARTFEELMRLEDFRSDAAIQLKRCHCLMENSFDGCLPRWNILPREPMPPLPGEQQGRKPVTSSSAQAGGRLASVVVTNSSRSKELLPSAAQGPTREWFTVWVGNLTPEITEEILLHYFHPFGPIDSIRRLPKRFCAFINYTRQEAAEAAYAALQGFDMGGIKLVLQLKHPVHATPPPTKAPGGAQLKG